MTSAFDELFPERSGSAGAAQPQRRSIKDKLNDPRPPISERQPLEIIDATVHTDASEMPSAVGAHKSEEPTAQTDGSSEESAASQTTDSPPLLAIDPLPTDTPALGVPSVALDETGAHLIDTSIGVLKTSDITDTAFRIQADGDIVTEEAVAITSTFTRDSGPQELDHYTATGHHFLAVSEAITDDEIEALAVSLWEGVGWSAPGLLTLPGGARIEGPWKLTDELHQKFGITKDKDSAWLLVCPPSRGLAPSEQEQKIDPWAHAFPTGLPQGVEAKMLRTLHQMARRLGGTVRIAGSGALFTPDPDSAVSLTLYTPRWLDPTDLLQTLGGTFEDIRDARKVTKPKSLPTRKSALDAARIKRLAEEMADMRPELKERIDEEIRHAQMNPQVLDAHAAVFSVGNRSQCMVEVAMVQQVPQALRWEQWARGAVVEYRLKWLPGSVLEHGSTGISRTLRLERARSAREIEIAAGLLVSAVGGSIIDEDGFIVAFDDE